MTKSCGTGAAVRTVERTGDRCTFLVSSVPSDSHTWNLVALQLILEEMGHRVCNLGPCVPIDLLLRACRAERPDCVVISTVNGHGQVDGARIITALRADPELAGLVVVIGGKLGVHGDADRELRHDLLERGFDAVFPVGAGDAARAVVELCDFVRGRT
jgi:methylaspartate mutase sigma subunit